MNPCPHLASKRRTQQGFNGHPSNFRPARQEGFEPLARFFPGGERSAVRVEEFSAPGSGFTADIRGFFPRPFPEDEENADKTAIAR